jgi:hypothetical protein
MLVRKAGLFNFTIALIIATSALAFNPASIGLAPSLYAHTAQSAAAPAQLSAERVIKHVEFLASTTAGPRARTPAAGEAPWYVARVQLWTQAASPAGFRHPFTFVSAVARRAEQIHGECRGSPRSLKVGEVYAARILLARPGFR